MIGIYTLIFHTVRDWQGRGLTNYIFLGSKNNNLSAAGLLTLSAMKPNGIGMAAMLTRRQRCTCRHTATRRTG